MYHLRAQITNFLVLEAKVPHEKWPVGEVNGDTREGFIQWRFCISKTGQAGAVSKAFIEGRTQGEEGVFSGVMIVD